MGTNSSARIFSSAGHDGGLMEGAAREEATRDSEASSTQKGKLYFAIGRKHTLTLHKSHNGDSIE
jgi:hypothetical protein